MSAYPDQGTPEGVAYRLFEEVCRLETNDIKRQLTRAEVIDLYAECLLAVKKPDFRLEGNYRLPPLAV